MWLNRPGDEDTKPDTTRYGPDSCRRGRAAGDYLHDAVSAAASTAPSPPPRNCSQYTSQHTAEGSTTEGVTVILWQALARYRRGRRRRIKAERRIGARLAIWALRR